MQKQKKEIMRKILLLAIFVALTIAVNAQAIKKTMLVYTLDSNSLFIPFINGKQMLMMPTDSFYYEFDTVQKFELTVHFDCDTISDIKKDVDFGGLKAKRYQIVRVSSVKEKAILKNPRYKKMHLYPLYKIKDESMMYYLQNFDE